MKNTTLNIKMTHVSPESHAIIISGKSSCQKMVKLHSASIVPQLSECLKFEAIQGDQTDQRICI